MANAILSQQVYRSHSEKRQGNTIRTSLTFAALLLASNQAFAQDGADPFLACAKASQTVFFNGKPQQRLTFDYLDCSAAGHNFPALRFQAGNVLRTVTRTGEDANGATAQLWPLVGKTPAERIAEIAGPLIAPEEKGRCEVVPNGGTGTFLYTGRSEYLDEIAAHGLWSACGPLGDSSETIQYWMVIDGALIAYVSLLQDTPLFDPASFKYVNTLVPGHAE